MLRYQRVMEISKSEEKLESINNNQNQSSNIFPCNHIVIYFYGKHRK